MIMPSIVSAGSAWQVSEMIPRRRLQEDSTQVFPHAITTGLLRWRDTAVTEIGACKNLFDDNESRCECFFSIEYARDGGVPVTEFAEDARCPATVNCILEDAKWFQNEPMGLRTWMLGELMSPWASDGSCPFLQCAWDTDGLGEPRTSPLDMGPPSCASLGRLPFFCSGREEAAFCVRTKDAQHPDGGINGHTNRVSSYARGRICCLRYNISLPVFECQTAPILSYALRCTLIHPSLEWLVTKMAKNEMLQQEVYVFLHAPFGL